jgi:hypothetical protein
MSYRRNKIIALIYRIFQEEDYKYHSSLTPPTYDEVEKVVEGLEESAIEVKGIAESGRIMVQYDKEHGSFDYYLSLGSSR